jgi:hypothetical protein
VQLNDTLTSSSTVEALTANQGKILQDTKAPLNSPALVGIPTAPTAPTGTDTDQIATTAFVMANSGSTGILPVLRGGTGVDTSTGTGSAVLNTNPTLITPDIGIATGISFNFITGLADTTPIMDGTAAVGVSTTVARADHVHPTDTSRAPLASPALTGTPTAPTAATTVSSTQLATTAFATPRTAATGASVMPAGTTAQRPATPQSGWLRYNTDLLGMEMYNGTEWVLVGSGGGVDYTEATDPLITTNPDTLGALWVNTTTGEIFTCVDIATNANRWVGTDNTIIPALVMSGLFGRIWNITSDTYKRVGLHYEDFNPATQNEFTTWLSPSASRVNDNDTSIPSDLTLELDTNTNLPFSYMARKVVDNTGAVSAFDHATAPTATQQIMTEIPKCYYIDALIVSDSKEYDVKIVSKTPFSVDVLADLGFASVTSITVFNPTTGISSGTVVGNVITSALHPAFVWATGAEADFTYVGSFHSVTGRSTFGTGVRPTASITLPTARTQHTGFGTNFNQHDFWNNGLVQLLAYIERGSNYLEQSGTKWDGNSSSYDGSQTSYDQDNGLTLGLQNRTGTIIGSVTDIGKVIANSYRGIENYHSALWMWIDAININGGICYLAKAGSTFVSDIATAPYFASGYTATVTASWQSINKWQAGTFIPHATAGGTTSTKVSDQMYGNTGWRVLQFGGSLQFGGVSGLSCWYGNSASSSALAWSIVSRASFRKFL